MDPQTHCRLSQPSDSSGKHSPIQIWGMQIFAICLALLKVAEGGLIVPRCYPITTLGASQASTARSCNCPTSPSKQRRVPKGKRSGLSLTDKKTVSKKQHVSLTGRSMGQQPLAGASTGSILAASSWAMGTLGAVNNRPSWFFPFSNLVQASSRDCL